MLESGDADFILYVPPADAQRLADRGDITIFSPHHGGYRYFGMNTQRPPFDNKLVRQALNYAIDKEAIVENIFYGFTKPLTSPYGSGQWGHVDVGPYPYDPDKARELLAEAGYPNGFSATMITNDNRPREALTVAQAAQAYLKEVGVDIEIEVLEWGVLLDRSYTPLEENTVEMRQASYGGADLDSLRIVLGCDQWPPRRNSSFYCNERVDELFQLGMFEADPAKRLEIYKELQEIVWDDAPWIFISDLLWIGAWSNKIEGLITYESNQNYYDLRWVTKSP